MTFERRYVDVRLTGRSGVTLDWVRYHGAHDTFDIPAGFRTDFASVPRWATAFVPIIGPEVTLAALVHDWLCDLLRNGTSPVSAVDADGIFRRILGEQGASRPLRELAWAGVRWGALADDWHRVGWWSTFPRLAAVTAAALLPPAVIVAALVAL